MRERLCQRILDNCFSDTSGLHASSSSCSSSSTASSSSLALSLPVPRPSRASIPIQQEFVDHNRRLVASDPQHAHDIVPPHGAASQLTHDQVVAFDVGGTLFHCLASLIRKYPWKRLHQVMSCGCQRLDQATFSSSSTSCCSASPRSTVPTFFIDRNPRCFEMILDWYRTGRTAASYHNHMDLELLALEAQYFDVYQEMFGGELHSVGKRISRRADAEEDVSEANAEQLPPPPRRNPACGQAFDPDQQQTIQAVVQSTRSHSSSPKAVSSSPSCSQQPSDPIDSHFYFCRKETHVLDVIDPSKAQVIFWIRANQQLRIVRITGKGKLLGRISDDQGDIQVQQTVLFDSNTYFYLSDNESAKLTQAIEFPGGHIYTFWMELHEEQMTPTPLEVEFHTIYAFGADERIQPGDLSQQLPLIASSKTWQRQQEQQEDPEEQHHHYHHLNSPLMPLTPSTRSSCHMCMTKAVSMGALPALSTQTIKMGTSTHKPFGSHHSTNKHLRGSTISSTTNNKPSNAITKGKGSNCHRIGEEEEEELTRTTDRHRQPAATSNNTKTKSLAGTVKLFQPAAKVQLALFVPSKAASSKR